MQRTISKRTAPRRVTVLRLASVLVILLVLAACGERAARRRAEQEPTAPATAPAQPPEPAEEAQPEGAQPEEASPDVTQPAEPQPEAPQPEAAQPAAQFASIQIVTEDGGRVDWSAAHNLIAFDRPDDSGVYQIWTITPQGTDETCLTCDQPDAPTHHKGNPAWHPSGEYLVFQASTESQGLLSGMATPGMGRNNNVWLMSRDGSRYVQLTDVPERMGVLHPHFSHDGARLVWAEKQEGMRLLRGEGEAWALRVADFVDDENGPRLENTQSYQPLGPVFYESHGFSPDGSRIIFTAFILPDEANQAWMDIYTLELATGNLTRLTNSPEVWDEHAHYSPDGSLIVWASSADCQCDPSRLRTLQMDLWLMQADGANPRRLTDLVASGADRNLAVDNSWGPDGRQIAVLLVNGSAPGRGSIALVSLP